MKKFLLILLLLSCTASFAQTIQGKTFQYMTGSSPAYAAYPNDTGLLAFNRTTRKFYRTTIAGAGGITGSGAAGQVAYWNGSSSLTGINNFWWDVSNNMLRLNGSSSIANIHAQFGDSATTKAILLPRVQDTANIASPRQGMFAYIISDGSVYYRTLTRWNKLAVDGPNDPTNTTSKIWAVTPAGQEFNPYPAPRPGIGTGANWGGELGLITAGVTQIVIPVGMGRVSGGLYKPLLIDTSGRAVGWGDVSGSGSGGIGSFEDSVANVRKFGALGNGTADDSAAIKLAIATGRPVYFPKGDYFTNAQLVPAVKGQVFFGDGRSSRLFTSQTNTAIIKLDKDSCEVRALSFYGTGKAAALPGWTSPTGQIGVWIMGYSCVVRDCYFKKLNSRGVYAFHPTIANINKAMISGNYFDNCTAGVETDYGADYAMINNNQFSNCYVAYLEGGGANMYVSDNIAVDNTYGIYLRGGAAHGLISGNSLNHNTSGLTIRSGNQGTIVSNNLFWFSTIDLGGADTVALVSFYNNQIASTTINAVKVKNCKMVGGTWYPTVSTTGSGLVYENIIGAGTTNTWYATGTGLGIGTVTPSEKLEVSGNIKASAPAYSSGGADFLVRNQTSGRFETKAIADEGSYTPTLFNTTNVAASTAQTFQYQVIGSVMHVWGEVDIDPTSATTLTVLGISLPASYTYCVSATTDLAGTAADDLNTVARVRGDVANSRAELRMTPTDVTNRRFSVHFTIFIYPC